MSPPRHADSESNATRAPTPESRVPLPTTQDGPPRSGRRHSWPGVQNMSALAALRKGSLPIGPSSRCCRGSRRIGQSRSSMLGPRPNPRMPIPGRSSSSDFAQGAQSPTTTSPRPTAPPLPAPSNGAPRDLGPSGDSGRASEAIGSGRSLGPTSRLSAKNQALMRRFRAFQAATLPIVATCGRDRKISAQNSRFQSALLDAHGPREAPQTASAALAKPVSTAFLATPPP